MTQTTEDMNQIIKFKSTNTTHEVFQLKFDENKTVLEYKEEIGQKLNHQSYNIKLIFKGKVLTDKEKAGQLNLKNNTVMMVLTKNKKNQKPTLTSAQQTIPRTNLSTGLGSTSPIGFGGYGIVNHPQYMSAISSAVDEQKMQQIMNDPYYQGMMQQLLDDPETLKQLLEQNPMTKQLMEQNPMLKMMMSNPAMMKMVFNKDTIKMVTEMKKKGENGEINTMQNLNGFAGLNGFGGINAQTQPQTQTQSQNNFGNPFMSMLGSGFGNTNAQNFNQPFPNLFSNPLFNGGMNGVHNQPSNSSIFPDNLSNLSQLMSNLSQKNQKTIDQQKYQTQIKELNSMGFDDKEKCIKFLKQSDGDIDKALQRLCLDDDEKEKQQKE